MRPPHGRLPVAAKVTIVAGVFVTATLALLLVRGMAFRTTVEWSSHLPDPAQIAFAAVSEHGILGLLALFVAAIVLARRTGVDHLARGIAAGVGVILAYLSSEIIKVLVSELRPCHNFSVATIATCPNSTDWSWPSNHAAIAAAIALAIVVMSPRLALVALPLALLIAVSRVVVGVHYFHDVVAGAALAAMVVLICVRWGTPLISGGLARAGRRPLLGRLITGGPTQRRAPSVST